MICLVANIGVGCGTGELVRWMTSQGITATGIDVAEMIEKARKKTQKLCEMSGNNFEEFLYKSIARLIVLEKR